MPATIPVPERPDFFRARSYWGDRKPPKDRAEMFSASVRAAADAPGSTVDSGASGNTATLRMYGPIDSLGGFWGISAQDVSAALDSLGSDVTEVRVRINSPGGDAFEGLAILNMLRAHPARFVAVVDGLAASAASFIASGAEETIMSPGTQMMIHDAAGFAYGPAAVMRKSASFLDSISNSLASLYAEAAGGTDADWRAVMVEETWFTAREAVDAGLADRVAVIADVGETETAGAQPDPTEGDAVENRFDLSIFNHAGRSNAPAPKPPTASASGSRTTTTQEGSTVVAFTDDQLTNMRQALGVAEDADEATILAALTEALDERAEPAAEPTVPEGHVVIPQAQLADLQAGASAGIQAAKKLQDKERDEFLDSVRTKFIPANRAAWAAEYDRNPEGTRAHFAAAVDIIPVSEKGVGSQTETSQDDATYMALFGETVEG